MRRIIAMAATVALAAGGVLSAPATYADEATTPDSTLAPAVEPEPAAETVETIELPVIPATPAPAPGTALSTARRVLAGAALPRDPSATVALRDLWMARDRLRGTERRQADALLARPTDGADDGPTGGYTAPSTAACNTRLCVHSVATAGNVDYTDPAWAAHTLAVMDSVWTTEVDSLGYRPPLADGSRGGSPLFDVYLKDLGGQLYGYCAAESRGPRRTAKGFCVLDNDFNPTQFPGPATPDGNLRVTAAHEFFHAVQYAYDYAEDPWMMESTATWMEERIASDVDDNRQYLPYSQLYAPFVPLDLFASNSFYQYGNWIFWEYLSTRYGTSIVNKAWREAGSLKKDGGKYSFQALQKVLKRKGGLTKVYTQFAGGNLVPAITYPEGGAYPAPKVKTKELSKRSRGKRYGVRLFHMSSRSFRFVAGDGLDGRKWKLALKVAGPAKRTSPAAHLVVHRVDGTFDTTFVKLNRRGDRQLLVGFDNTEVAAVYVTLVNGSTRMRCNRRTVLACGGRPLDDRLRFGLAAKVVKRR